MMTLLRRSPLLFLVAALWTATALAAPPQKPPPPPQPQQQQQPQGPPNALQGFSQNRDQPVHIEAATLEVRDKLKEATFSGDVHVIQGDTDMRCKTLVVFYEGGPGGPGPAPATATAPAPAPTQTSSPSSTPAADNKTLTAAEPGPNGEQRIKRLEARGGVVVTQKDQTATGDLGIFEMKTNTVTLIGNVVMTQGKNVLRGDRLVVNLTTGISRVESGKNGSGRVQGLFLPGSGPPGMLPGSPGTAAAPPAAPAAPATTTAPTRPSR